MNYFLQKLGSNGCWENLSKKIRGKKNVQNFIGNSIDENGLDWQVGLTWKTRNPDNTTYRFVDKNGEEIK